jgi:hypothetical protein
MKHTLTFFNLGNADCCRIDLHGGQKLLFDYADMRDRQNPDDRRVDLPRALREDLGRRNAFDVVAFTHADNDHVCGASSFFYLEHSASYQDTARIHINELWVPAAFIIESRDDLNADARALQAEARYRLIKGKGIRVFSRPARLAAWLRDRGLSIGEREHLITDAGRPVPGYTLANQGVEFFIHSPFARRINDVELFDRNDCSLALQATFRTLAEPVRLLLSADISHDMLSELIGITRFHQNDERLRWDVFKLPHHCSYKSLSAEKGKDATTPDEPIKWLFEKQGGQQAIIVSTSDPIPLGDTVQPPHRQAANYYRRVAREHGYHFIVTMEHPSAQRPEPLVITLDHTGATLQKRNLSSGGIVTSRPAPRAG